MQKSLSIVELAQQLEKIENEKRDYVVPSTKMSMVNGRDLMIEETGMFNLSPLAHEQIGARLNIPREYYKRMQEAQPDLLDQNVNTWLQAKPERRFIRTYDGNVRAVLSDRYKPKENYAVASVLLPVLHQAKDVEVMSAQLTEKNMHIKVISHNLVGELQVRQGEHHVGSVLKGGISIRNSEVGCGAYDLSLFIYVVQCMNGMIREHSMKSYHIGKRMEVGDNEEIGFYSREAIEADSKAFILKVRDTLQFAFDKKKFDEELEVFHRAAANPMNTKAISESIEDVTKRFSLTIGEGKEVLSRLLVANDFSQWGLANAVTNLANDVTDYERATELERVGGRIIDLNPTDWRVVNRMAA